MACLRAVENTGIYIEANDVSHASLDQLRTQNAVTAPDVQHARRSGRNGIEKQRVIVDIGIPEFLRGHVRKHTAHAKSVNVADSYCGSFLAFPSVDHSFRTIPGIHLRS